MSDNFVSNSNMTAIMTAIGNKIKEGGHPSDLGTAAYCDYTTTITQGSTDLPTGGAVYNYIDSMITQALTGSY